MICERCRKQISLSDEQIEQRELEGLKTNLCQWCFRDAKKRRGILSEDALYFGTKTNPFTWDMFCKNKEALQNSSKLFVKVKCCVCGKDDIRRIDKLVSSKYTNNLEICNNCIPKFVCNTSEWKTINSEAQKIAQNKPETKRKMREAMIKVMDADKFFSLKRSFNNTKTLRGFYKGMYFASSYELSFLYEHQSEAVSYCFDKIPYMFEGEMHFYSPDFVINDTVYEIKGAFDERSKEKIAAGERFYDKFVVYTKDDIVYDFSTSESLSIFGEELIITNLPSSIKCDRLFMSNHPHVKALREKFFAISDIDKAKGAIAFYTSDYPGDFWSFYVSLVNSDIFIKHVLLKKIDF